MKTKIFILFIVMLYGCGNSAEPNIDAFVETSDVPVISGIYHTTFFEPEGTGIIYGSPNYYRKRIGLFPNPLIITAPEEMWHNPPEVIVGYLPQKVKVKIVKGNMSANNRNGVVFNNSIYSINAPTIVRTFEKNDNSQFMRWDLKDDNNNDLPTGLYRIYLESEMFDQKYFDSNIIWVDFYLLRYQEFKSGIDPTGWLPSNFNVIVSDLG